MYEFDCPYYLDEEYCKSKEDIYEEIKEYYFFHKNIKKFFEEGFNFKGTKKKEKLYFIDKDWIDNWKELSNYNKVVKYLDKGSDYNDCLIKVETYYNNDLSSFSSGKSDKNFLLKRLLTPEDFDCLINENFYYFFPKHYSYFYPVKSIKYIFYDKFLVLLFDELKIIKIFYQGYIGSKKEIIQLNINFLANNNINNINEEGFFNKYYKKINNYLFYSDVKDNNFYESFIKEYIKDDDFSQILDFCTKYDKVIEEEIFNEEGFFICHLLNNNLYKMHLKNLREIGFSESLLKNINNPTLIGLKNLGSTCYINAVIQCLVNIDKLTRYLLNNDIFFTINKNDKCEILNGYCQLLEKLCCDEDIEKKFNPKEFIMIINNRSSLFRKDMPNDSKDFLYFLLEQMNDDFNQTQLKIKNNLNYININRIIYENIQNNRNLMLINFINDFSSKNNNIIPKLFYSIIEFETICISCNNHLYNFQTLYSLEFALEDIYYKKNGKNNNLDNYKYLSLYDCFSNYNETTISNNIYCKTCKSKKDATYINSIYSLPPILIITLNRGKNNKFSCDVDFPETLNVQNYIHSPFSNYKYTLIGVVSYYYNIMFNVKGHFIAFCKHRIIKEWYCYDDEKVTICDNLFRDIKYGTPYILIYESTQEYENMLFNDNFLLKEQNNNHNMNNNMNNNNMKNNNMYNNNMNNHNINMNNMNNNNMNSKNIYNNNMNNNNMNSNNMNNNNMNFEKNMNFKNMNMINFNSKNNINLNNINNRTNININKNNKIFQNNMNNNLFNNSNNNIYNMNNINSNMNNNNISKMNYLSNKISNMNYINNNKNIFSNIMNNKNNNMYNHNMNNNNMSNNNMNNNKMNKNNMNNNNTINNTINNNINNNKMNINNNNNINNNRMNNDNMINNNMNNNNMNNHNMNNNNMYNHNMNNNNMKNNSMNNNNINNNTINNMNNNNIYNNNMNNNNMNYNNMNNNNMNNNINNNMYNNNINNQINNNSKNNQNNNNMNNQMNNNMNNNTYNNNMNNLNNNNINYKMNNNNMNNK